MSRPSNKHVQWLTEYFQTHDYITSEEILARGWDRGPASALINRLRCNGLNIQIVQYGNKANDHCTVWQIIRGSVSQQYLSQQGEGPNLDTLKVPCPMCGGAVSQQVWPGDKPVYKLCGDCRAAESRDHDCKHIPPEPKKNGKPAYSDCKVYRPGDRGFESRAKACTPPRQIKTRLADLVSSVRFSFKY